MDCTFLTDEGKFNFRVGALIKNGSKVLMARNPNEQREFYYSVGGRVKFGESAEQAVLREVKEETGIDCEVQRLAAVHENFFTDDDGVPFHEISFFFLLKPNEALLSIPNGHKTTNGPDSEYLVWIDLNACDGITLYPEFYKTEEILNNGSAAHFITYDR